MGLALIDLMSVGRPRLFSEFVRGPAQAHIYMAHVGAGWAVARCPWGILTFFPRLDPLLKWLAIDGLGFHEGYFHPAKFIASCRTSWKRRSGPEVFDNGLGRAIWFASGARIQRICKTLAIFPSERRPALWSGIGLAATYAGGASVIELEELLSAAGKYSDEVAQGAAFAAKARCRAGNLTENTDTACKVFQIVLIQLPLGRRKFQITRRPTCDFQSDLHEPTTVLSDPLPSSQGAPPRWRTSVRSFPAPVQRLLEPAHVEIPPHRLSLTKPGHPYPSGFQSQCLRKSRLFVVA